MKFKAKTEKEIAEENNIPNGDYAYEVLSAEDKISAAGNDMIALTLRIFVGEASRQLTDFLLESMPGKLFHFCSYTGLARQYQDGTLTADDCLGKSGYLTIGTSKGKKKENSDEYWPDRPNVKDYIRNIGGVKAAVIATPKKDDGDVPF